MTEFDKRGFSLPSAEFLSGVYNQGSSVSQSFCCGMRDQSAYASVVRIHHPVSDNSPFSAVFVE